MLFEQFEWEQQAAEAEQLQKVAPTFTVKADHSDELVWISVGTNENGSLFYVTDLAVLGIKNYFFGLWKRKGLIGDYLSETDFDTAKNQLQMFFQTHSVPGGV